MTCSPNDNNINIPVAPLPSVPGFGVPVAPVQIPLDSFDLPQNLLEDFNDLVNKLFLIFPSSTFKPNIEFPLKTILDYVSNLLSQIAPFLSLFNFFSAVLRMFKCIIDILCALPNMFSVAAKLKVLFTECLPQLLAIFPPLSLPIMIISLLLLLLQLILYIIQAFSDIIDSILHNLTILQKGLQLNDADAQLAAAQKIAMLLCSLQNILAIFVALAAIFDVIKTLAKFATGLICDDGDTDGCCDPAICPDFVKLTPDGIIVSQGQLRYFKKIGFDAASALGLPPDIAATLSSSLGSVRAETWQIFDLDTGSSQYPINLIITPTPPDGNIFFPNDQNYSATTPFRQAPYTVDIRIKLNPTVLGFTNTAGERFFRIKNCIVVRKPHTGAIDYKSDVSGFLGIDGVLDIEGGLVYEDDGTTAYKPNGTQLTLNTFIHQSSSSATSLPTSDDSLNFSVEFTWKPNAPALAGLNLTTVGCIPDIATEKTILNNVLLSEGIEPIEIKFGNIPGTDSFLPDITGAQQCILGAISDFRKDINLESLAIFKATTTQCLNTLQSQTNSAICSALIATISQFKTTAEIVPDLQFTSRVINIKVTLKDATGTLIGKNIPQTCVPFIEERLTTTSTFGTISPFKYDGTEFFLADVTSDLAGSGTITVLFDNKVLSTYNTAVNGNTSNITENQLTFTFISAGISSPERRDATDIAQDNKGI